jgi:organic radical activating enzyme
MMDYVKYTPLKNKFITLALSLGTVCNYSCSYCTPALYNGKFKFPNSIDNIIRFIEKIEEKYPDEKIFLTFFGGEVTLWKHFKTFVEQCKLKGIAIRIVSNGSRSIKWWETVAHLLHSAIISYHTEFASEQHITEVMKLFKKGAGIVSLMVPPPSFDETIEIGKRISKNAHVYVIPKYLRKNFKTELYPYTQEQLKLFSEDYVSGFGQEYLDEGYFVHKGIIIEKEDGTVEKYRNGRQIFLKELNRWKGWKCWGGIEGFLIDEIGDIFIGQCREGKFGNINEDNYKLPDEPYICNKEVCNCTQDILEMKREKVR